MRVCLIPKSTMLIKIKKIKNLGLVFRNFHWCTSAPDFKHINVVYGWNGSGKTTLTRLFDAICGHADTEIEFSLENNDGKCFSDSDPYPYPIRVFNEDYVNRNIDILQSRTRRISILLGEGNKAILREIGELEEQLNGRHDDPMHEGELQELNEITGTISRLEKEIGQTFTDIARTISAAASHSNTAARNYKKPQAENEFHNLNNPKTLSDVELNARKSEMGQEVRNKITSVELSIRFEEEETETDILQWLSQLLDRSSSLAEKTTSARTIARLVAEPIISDWVEEGFKLHQKYAQGTCEYCGNTVSADRIAVLAAHFNDEDRALKEEIDQTIKEVQKTSDRISTFAIPDPQFFLLRSP